MGDGWADQLRGGESRYSPKGLQASLGVWDTWNGLLDITRRGGNTECDLWREKWVSAVGRVGRGGDWAGRLISGFQEAAEANRSHNGPHRMVIQPQNCKGWHG